MGGVGGILLFSPTVWAGSGGEEEGHTHTHTNTHTQRNTHTHTKRNVHANVALTLYQAPPSYGSGREGFGVWRAQDSISLDRCSVGTRHAFLSITFLSIWGSVLERTELCHEVRNCGPQKPQIIRNESHHLALFDFSDLPLKSAPNTGMLNIESAPF